eukprot:jgi/Ulvmu1/1744/UM117_0021.1
MLNVSFTRRCNHRRPRPPSPRTRSLPPAQLPATFLTASRHSHDLLHLLYTPATVTTNILVRCTPGPWHLVNHRALLRDYGRSAVVITSSAATVRGQLRHLATHLPTARHILFAVIIDGSPHRTLSLWKLALLLHPDATQP